MSKTGKEASERTWGSLNCELFQGERPRLSVPKDWTRRGKGRLRGEVKVMKAFEN